jgi:hypothetical protein
VATAILSQDIMAICLLCTDGNVHLNLGEVIHHVEDYQKAEHRHFGISSSDFRGLFRSLISGELFIRSYNDEIDDIIFSEIITDILEYHDAYFNDEGEHWVKACEIDSDDIFSWYDYSEMEYEYKIEIKHKMKKFFGRPDMNKMNPEFVRTFMKEINLTNAILYHCSRPGTF